MTTHNKAAVGAIASDLDEDRVWVKETRTGTPLVMARGKAGGHTLAVVHRDPQITAGGEQVFMNAGMVSGELQYGSLGYDFTESMAIGYVYPSSEGPINYDMGGGWSSVYHPVEEGFSHSYRLLLIPGQDADYQDAMVRTFLNAFPDGGPQAVPFDNERFYELNLELFNSLYLEFSSPTVTAPGLPFDVSVMSAQPFSPISYQIGFVGAQTAVANQLLRSGFEKADALSKSRAEAMLDFWASDLITGTAVPVVWWTPANDAENAGAPYSYPSFLRCFVDGMESMLDAYLTARRFGEEHADWRQAFMKTADFLVDHQNEDGSYYRAYNTDGTVCLDKTNMSYQGDSKLNTPIAIRFLGKVYELTGEEKYKQAALRAAEFGYNTLYRDIGKYVGGTPDNPNTVDKEAAIYAMYGFDAAYVLSGDEKYAKALEHATVSVMSWTLTYDYAVPYASSGTYDMVNPFKQGGLKGLGFIATGHSSVDTFASVASYDLYRQYVRTGNALYKQFAGLLQNNTKVASNHDSSKGYYYAAFMIEAINVADFMFSTAGNGVWLPWIGISYVNPYLRMKDAFGAGDLFALDDLPLEQQRDSMMQYGLGGHV